MRSAADLPQVVAALRAIVGPAGMVLDPAESARYLVDERQRYHGRAAAIVRPETVAELAAVVGTCHAAGVAMVPQGGNTGYCGGATPGAGGDEVLILLSRLRRVQAVDEIGFTLTAEAGVTLAEARAAAAAHGMLLPLSMGSEGSCQIGGNLSTNAGGLAVLRYGTARELVLGLEVVLPDGRVWNGLSALRKDNTGYDLKQVFLGAEGTLGIIAAAVLRLFPQPIARETLWLAVADLDAACATLALARRVSGDAVTSCEYVSRRSLDYVLAGIPETVEPLGGCHEHYLLIELSAAGTAADLPRAAEEILRQAASRALIVDGSVAQNERQRRHFWRLRETIPEAEKRAGGSIKHDVSVAIGRIADFTARAIDAVAALAPGARLSIYGHLGDGNVHFNVLPPAGADAELFGSCRAAAVSAAIHGIAASMDGSFSAEHGVGQLKRDLLAATKNPVALDLMRRLKAMLDPRGLMNPGKVL